MTIKLQLRKAVKRLEYSYSKNFFGLPYVCFKVNSNKIKISPVWQICLKVFAGACLFAFQTKTFAQNNWTGATGTDWATAENWSTSLVPTATDDVIIPATANQPVISTTGALAKTVEVQSGATLTIQSTGILAVNGSKTTSYYGSITAFFNNGTVQNNGILLIGNVSAAGYIGLLNLATFNNNTGGHISIDRSTGDGLLNASGTFTNMSSLTIGAAANVGVWGVENYGTFKNNTGGQISIDRSTSGGFYNNDVFTNAAAITIGAVASVGANGLFNLATFSNNTGGQISIDRTTNYGLYNGNSSTNAATITIGAVASVGSYGLANFGPFTNNTGGQISIDRSTSVGLYNVYGTFTNAATITIGAVAGVGTSGILNRDQAMFNNSGCAVLTLSAALNNSGSFTNAGLFTVNTSQPHSNTALTNNGVISYPQGNAIPNVTNNALIASPASSTCVPVISPALQIAAGNNFVVGTTWYQDAALSTVAGTYTPNTFTATNLAAGSSYMVYFTVNDPVNGCTRTVSLYVTVNGTSEWYKDADGDGYSDGTMQLACDRPTGYKPGSELTAMSVDCNDDDLAINPGATEVCDGIDNNCDGSIDEGFTDTDGDALADCADPDDDNDGVLDGQDCAPLDATTWRTGNFYADGDGDGYGSGTTISMCYGANTPTGYSTVGGDCNDDPAAGGAAIHPGATEMCDGIDNNCDGNIDEGFTNTDGDAFANCVDADDDNDGVLDGQDCAPLDATTWRTGNFYADSDGDGYGSGTAISMCYGANTPTGYSTVGGDCNNDPAAGGAAIHPGATEVCDGIDNNCDGNIDEGFTNTDGDAFANCVDADDDNDGILDENDCAPRYATKWRTGNFYADGDHDGYGRGTTVSLCYGTNTPTGYSTVGGDCNDANAAINPSAVEICGNGIDDNCNGQIDEGVPGVIYYRDKDGDGYGNPAMTTTASCGAAIPRGYVSNSTDCNDNNAAVRPGAPEICDGIDNNCNGQIDEGVKTIYYRDADGDGYGNVAMTTQACTKPSGYVTNNTDCNDGSASVRPGAVEVCGNGIDDNCNGQVDENCGTACNNATNLTTTNITSGSATLNWVAAVNPVAWQVQYKTTSPGAKWKDVSPVPVPSARSVTISGLAAGQTYNWHIAAKCGNTWTSYADASSFKTLTVLARSINIESQPLDAVEEKPSALKLYPNPSSGQFMVDLHLAERINGTAKLQLIDLTGRTVYVGSAVVNDGVLQKKISISSLLSSGIYTVEIIANGKSYFAKLMYGK